MCRFAFYTGPPQPLSALLYAPRNSLHEQAYRPREQQHGVVNVDGTGVVWWRDGDPDPLRYVTAAPPWSDPNLPTLAPRLTGRTILAAVRGATPGTAYGTDAVAPFVHSGLAFVHNGWIGGFRGGVGPELVRRLPDDLAGSLAAHSDSLLLFLTILRHRPGSDGLAGAVRAALSEVAGLCAAAGEPATLTVLVTDGTETVAARGAVGLDPNSLYVCTGGSGTQDATLVASEPLDDGPWVAVDADGLVRIAAGHVDHAPLALEDRT